MNDLMSGDTIACGNRFARPAKPRAGELLLDVAGGTGDIADGYLKRGGDTAIICDINPKMLAAGENRSLDRGNLVAL